MMLAQVLGVLLAVAVQFNAQDAPVAEHVPTRVELNRFFATDWAGARSISAAPNGAVVIATGDEGVRAWRVLPTGELEERWSATPEQLAGVAGWSAACVAVSPNARLAAVTLRPPEPWAATGQVAIVESVSGRVLWRGSTGYGPRELAWLENSRGVVIADEGPVGVERGPVPEDAEPGPNGEPPLGPILSVIDPPGSVTVARTREPDWSDAWSTTLALTGDMLEPDRPGARTQGRVIRLHPMNETTPELDMEPRGVASLGRIAYVMLPVNNGVVAVDAIEERVVGIRPLTSIVQMLDAGPNDGGVRIEHQLRAMPMPTSLAIVRDREGVAIIATANTGVMRGDLRDAAQPFRDHAPLLELYRQDYLAEVLANFQAVRDPAALGSLHICTFFGIEPAQGLLRPHAFGSRSVSVWDGTSLNRLSDTGSMFEYATGELFPEHFNARPEAPLEIDATSAFTGPEPSSIDVAQINGRLLAVTALRNPGGLAVTDITVRTQAQVVGFILTAPESDLGSVDAAWVRWGGEWLVATAHETSGTITLHLMDLDPQE